MTAEDALMIIINMKTSAMEDPALESSILPKGGVYQPSGMGTPWCEFENAAIIHEMSIIARQGAIDKNVRKNLFANLSHILNVKYGIDRSEASCKNQWYRELRARSGIDERACFRTTKEAARLSDNLRVSLNNKITKTKPKTYQSKSKTKTKVHQVAMGLEKAQAAMAC
jgi:vancomycin resistance protein YoaR